MTVSQELEEKHFRQISEAVRGRLGIDIPPKKYYMLRARLARVMKEGRFQSLDSLCQGLETDNEAAWDVVARQITTTHTYFFRESDHFDLVIARLREAGITRPRIWCAACSSGEEPYSIAIRLAEEGFSDFTLVGSDINKAALAKAHDGVFDALRLREAGKARIARWFTSLPDGRYRVSPVLRKTLRLKCLNIMDELSFDQSFDVVFCRNVMIYFRPPEVARVVDTLSRNVAPGGMLVLGKTESLQRVPDDLEKLTGSIYRKK